MVNTKVARRYAASLLGFAREQKVLDAIRDDMQLVHSVCSGNRALALLLRNPVINTDKKITVLREVFGKKINKVSMSFMEIIARKRREEFLESIAEEYTNLYKQDKGIATAIVTSAIPLDEALKEKITGIVNKTTGAKAELVEKTDRRLIGGFILRVGDKQYDASILKNLKKLTREFNVNPYIRKN